MAKHHNVAYILDHNNKYVWVRVPLWKPHTVFTMPRDWLPHGFATATAVEVEYDPLSAHFDGWHITADMEIIGAITTRTSLHSEGSGEEGE